MTRVLASEYFKNVTKDMLLKAVKQTAFGGVSCLSDWYRWLKIPMRRSSVSQRMLAPVGSSCELRGFESHDALRLSVVFRWDVHQSMSQGHGEEGTSAQLGSRSCSMSLVV